MAEPRLERIQEGQRVHLKHTHKNGVAQGRFKDGLVSKVWVLFDGEDEPSLESEAMLIPVREPASRGEVIGG